MVAGADALIAATPTYKASYSGLFKSFFDLVDDAARSRLSGRIEPHAGDPTRTIADGLRTTLGKRTFPVIRELVDDIITVPETEIRQGLRLVMERAKLVIEPSAAVGIVDQELPPRHALEVVQHTDGKVQRGQRHAIEGIRLGDLFIDRLVLIVVARRGGGFSGHFQGALGGQGNGVAAAGKQD